LAMLARIQSRNVAMSQFCITSTAAGQTAICATHTWLPSPLLHALALGILLLSLSSSTQYIVKLLSLRTTYKTRASKSIQRRLYCMRLHARSSFALPHASSRSGSIRVQ
jgi:hypothetical protein